MKTKSIFWSVGWSGAIRSLSLTFGVGLMIAIATFVLSPKNAFAAVVQKICDPLYLDGSNWKCYFHSPSAIGEDGVYDIYNGYYPDTSGLVSSLTYQSSNTNYQITGYQATTTQYQYHIFRDVSGDDWVYQFEFDGTVPSQDLSEVTRIISFTPPTTETATTSSPVTISVIGYVNENNYEDNIFGDTALRIVITHNACNTGTFLAAGTQGIGLGSQVQCNTTYDYDIEASGDFSFSTTTALDNGLYTMAIRLNNNTLVPFFQESLAATSSSFIIAELSYVDEVILSSRNATASLYATTTSPYCDQIFPFSFSTFFASTTFANGVACLLIPDPNSIAQTFNDLRNNFLTKAPFGYITRVYDILTASTSIALPTLSYTFSSTFPLDSFASKEFYFNPWPYFYVDGAPLKDELLSTVDGDNKNAWEIIEPLFTFLVYMGLLFIIISDIIGIDLHPGESKIERKTDIFATKGSRKGQVVRSSHTISRSKRL